MKRTILTIVASAALLTGCAAQPAPTQPTPAPPVVAAADTCAQVGNVLTVLFNASISNSELRSTDQELDGALALADSMLDYVTSEPSSDFEAIVLRLREVDSQDYALAAVDNGSEEWSDAIEDLNDACSSAGAELAVSAWTGG